MRADLLHGDAAAIAGALAADEFLAEDEEIAVPVAQADVKERLLKAYFTDGLNIGDPDVLAECAAEIGFERAAVIDFGTCGVGDPACDLAIAWTLLTVEGRQVFRETLAVDEAAWSRGRGWALWKTLATYVHMLDDVDEADPWRCVLDAIIAEYASLRA